LTAEGYNSSTPIVQKTGANTSKITVPYAGNSSKKNITAEYVNNTIRNVEIEEEKENKNRQPSLAGCSRLRRPRSLSYIQKIRFQEGRADP